MKFLMGFIVLLGVTGLSLAKSLPVEEPRMYEVAVFPTDDQTRSADCTGLKRRCDISFAQLASTVNAPSWWAEIHAAGFRGVRVTFSRGVYRVSQPLLIEWAPVWGGRLEITGETAVISGSIPLSFKGMEGGEAVAYRGLPEASVGQVVIANLKAYSGGSRVGMGFGIPVAPSFGELIYRGVPQPLARWPNAGYSKIVAKGPLRGVSRDFQIEGRNASDWAGERQLRAHAYWSKDWADQTFFVDVVKVDGASFLRVDGLPFEGVVKSGQRVRIENAVSELDVEGEWVFDADGSSVIWWPPEGFGGSNVEFSVAESLLIVRNSNNVAVSGLLFENSRGDGVVVEGGSNVVFDQISVRNVSGRGVRISSGHKNGLKNSLVESAGQGGVSVEGGDRPSLTSSGHYVSNCEIREFNRLVKTYRPGVQVSGVGVSVSGNRIHGGTHSAIVFTGNDHLIKSNEIFAVVVEAADAGAIYGGRDYAARGTRIERNYLHDIVGAYSQDVKGIYIDDLGSGVSIVENVFFRVRKPIYLGGGRDNLVRFNVLIDSAPSIHLDARGVEWQRRAANDPEGEFLGRLNSMPFKDSLWATKYPHLYNVLEDDFGLPKYNEFCGNLILGEMILDVSERALGGISVVGNLRASESQLLVGSVLKAIEVRDFRLGGDLDKNRFCR